MRSLVILFFILPVVGCSSVPTSEAYHIAKAGNLDHGLHDVSKADMDKQLAIRQSSQVSGVVLAAEHATNTIAPMSGLSSLSSAGLALIFGTQRDLRTQFTQVLVWMPRSDAADDEAARLRLESILLHALQSGLPDGYTSQIVTVTKTASIGTVSTYKKLVIHGHDCNTLDCVIYSRVFRSSGKPTTGESPQWLGSQDSWVWKYSYTGSLGETDFNTAKKGHYPFDMLRYYAKVSQQLPAWCYLYVAPKRGLSTFPVIYHQGQALYFIKPANSMSQKKMSSNPEQK